jgi:hypothetical protein
MLNDHELLEFINSKLKPKEKDKKENGEVFTPLSLVNEMLDKLDEAHIKEHGKSIFTEPSFKWFDPAVGIGNFPIMVYQRLMKGLDIPDEEERRKHILEQMIYAAELNSKNTEIYKKIFNGGNLYEGDTLKMDIMKEFGVDKFDIIMGNPPFQEVSKNGVSKGGGNNLYTKFIYYADKNLNKNGYLLFINPPTYFSPGRSNNKNDMNLRKDVFDNYCHHYINLEECAKHFKVGSKFIYYVIQKNSNKNDNIEVVCKYNNIVYKSKLNQDLLIRDYLPYLLTNECLEILDKVKYNSDKLKIFNSPDNRSDKKHVLNKLKEETFEDYKKRALENGFIYPIQATGVQVVYSSKKCKNQNDKKVLMSESGYLKPFYDNGIIGVGGHCFACLVKDENEGNKIIALLNSKLYKFYIETNKWSGFHNKEVLQDLPNIIDKIDINDENIYKYFNITRRVWVI